MNKNCLKSIALAGILILPGMSHAMGYPAYNSFENNQNMGGGYGSTQYNNFGTPQNMGTSYAGNNQFNNFGTPQNMGTSYMDPYTGNSLNTVSGNSEQEQFLKKAKKSLKKSTQYLQANIELLNELIAQANRNRGIIDIQYLLARLQDLQNALAENSQNLAIVQEQKEINKKRRNSI